VGNIYFIGQRTPGFTVESPYFKKLYWLNVLFLLKYCFELVLYDASLFLSRLYFLRTIPLLLTWIMRSSVRKCTLSRWRILRNTESRWRSCLRRFCPPPKKGGFVVYFNASTSGHVQVCYFIPVLCTDGLDGASTASSLLYIFIGRDSLRLLSLIIPDIEFFLWLTIFELGFFLSTRCTTSYFHSPLFIFSNCERNDI
jgi:hypothetical protein